MTLGMLIMKKSYSTREYVSIVMISVGICICTLASANEKAATTEKAVLNEDGFSDFFWWIVGITMLTLALVLSAGMGLIQERLYSTHGKRNLF